jgi:hypothetical protein
MVAENPTLRLERDEHPEYYDLAYGVLHMPSGETVRLEGVEPDDWDALAAALSRSAAERDAIAKAREWRSTFVHTAPAEWDEPALALIAAVDALGADASYPRQDVTPYTIGDHVEKAGGDYTYVGVVVAAFTKLSGAVRYVVEDERGLLFIFSDKVLKAVGGDEGEKR